MNAGARKLHEQAAPRREAILALREKGWSLGKIAKFLGVSRQRVSRIVLDYGRAA